MTHYVSDIFADKPKTWGLRGDPDFWEYLRNYFSSIQLPYSEKELENDILEKYKLLTGVYPAKGKSCFAKSFATVHKGMSTGLLDSDYWIERGIPLLIKRLKIANKYLQDISCADTSEI